MALLLEEERSVGKLGLMASKDYKAKMFHP
jgi:hypothetical protein